MSECCNNIIPPPMKDGLYLMEESVKDDSLSSHCQVPTDSPESPPMQCDPHWQQKSA